MRRVVSDQPVDENKRDDPCGRRADPERFGTAPLFVPAPFRHQKYAPMTQMVAHREQWSYPGRRILRS